MKKPTNATVLFPLLCSDLPWIPPTLWTPLGSPFLPVPAAPAQGLPCPGTRKSLVWTSLFWIPARVPFCHLLPLPRDFLVLVRKSLVWTSGLLFSPVHLSCVDAPSFTCPWFLPPATSGSCPSRASNNRERWPVESRRPKTSEAQNQQPLNRQN